VKQVLLVVNPFATSVTPDRIAAVEHELGRVASVRTELTERPEHATDLSRDAGGVDAVVVFSGDGTYNEALNGVDGIPIGFVPGGGTSVLPRALGVPRGARPAAAHLAAAIEAGRTRRISLGRVNGRRFSFSAGIGFDAEAVRRLDALGRNESGERPGDLTFLLTVARMIAQDRGRYEPALEIEGLGRAAFLLVANGDPYSYAGPLPLHIAPQAKFELGLDLVAPKDVRPRSLARLTRTIFTGRSHRSNRDVLYGHDLDRIVVHCDRPLPLQVDGEDLGDVTEALFEAERDAVSVLL
jgi:diacylglycerol kinase family enzyme